MAYLACVETAESIGFLGAVAGGCFVLWIFYKIASDLGYLKR